jgi:hypothetical protein
MNLGEIGCGGDWIKVPAPLVVVFCEHGSDPSGLLEAINFLTS